MITIMMIIIMIVIIVIMMIMLIMMMILGMTSAPVAGVAVGARPIARLDSDRETNPHSPMHVVSHLSTRLREEAR